MPATATRPPKYTAPAGRPLREWAAASPAGSPLTVDPAAGVIYGVKVIGFRSRNSHGLREATGGTEYTRACLQGALPLYEGADVLVDHQAGGRSGPRSSAEVFGKLRNARLAADGVRADLHFLKAHPLAPRVCEDVQRGLGAFGLSHDATAGRERFDPANKRLVVESLSAVRSVDLVVRPASNRNLWESDPVSLTFRQLLESAKPGLLAHRRRWLDRLLEDDAMAGPLDAPAPDAGADADPAAALKDGFKASIDALVEQALAGEIDPKTAKRQIDKLLTTHFKLTQDAGADDADGDGDADAADADAADADADGGKKESEEEIRRLKHQIAVRDLIEQGTAAGAKIDPTVREALDDLPLAKARKLVEREVARARAGAPRSGPPPAKKPARAVATNTAGKTFLERITAD